MASTQLIHAQTHLHELALILLSELTHRRISFQHCAQEMEMDETEFMEHVDILMNHDDEFAQSRVLDNRLIAWARIWLRQYPQLRHTNYFESQLVDHWPVIIVHRRVIDN